MSKLLRLSRRLSALALVVIVASAATLRADEIRIGKLAGTIKTTLVFGIGIREATPHKDLVGAGAATSGEFPGATGGIAVVDDYQLNYLKGSMVGAPATLMSDIRLLYKNSGAFIRVRAWYEMAMNAKKYPHGNPGNVYAPNAKLSDDSFMGAAKFQGIDIHDIYFFGDYNVGGPTVHVKIGRQVVNWGEGLLYPGIASFNPYDYAWLSMIGSPVANAGMLPVARLYGGIDLPGGISVDGFYNLEWRTSVFPGCGTYSSFVDNGFQPGCNIVVAAGAPDQSLSQLALKSYWAGKTFPAGPYPNGGPDNPVASREPSAGGQYGIAGRKFVQSLKTEVGVYYTRFKSVFPTISMLPGPTPLDFAVNNMWAPPQTSFAVSASSGVRNVALSGQVTYTHNVPGQRNFPEMIRGLFEKKGPYDYISNFVGQEFPGYKQLNVTQVQFGGTAEVGRYIGMRTAQITAETAMQFVNNMPPIDGPGAERILRFGNFGYADFSGPGGACPREPLPNGIVNKCDIDGYATPFSMGIKMRFSTQFPQFGPGITLTPIATFGSDPFGFSSDGSINGGRVSASGFLRADFRQRFFAQAGLNWFRRGAIWDANRDKGNYLFTFGVNLQ